MSTVSYTLDEFGRRPGSVRRFTQAKVVVAGLLLAVLIAGATLSGHDRPEPAGASRPPAAGAAGTAPAGQGGGMAGGTAGGNPAAEGASAGSLGGTMGRSASTTGGSTGSNLGTAGGTAGATGRVSAAAARPGDPSTGIAGATVLGATAIAGAAGGGRAATAAGAGSSADAGRVGAPKERPAFVLGTLPSGALVIAGQVDSSATRDGWLNAVRVAARGRPVEDRLRIGAGATAPQWESLVGAWASLIRDRKIAQVMLEGDTLSVQGVRGLDAATEAAPALRRGLPPGIRMAWIDAAAGAPTQPAGGPKERARADGRMPGSPATPAGSPSAAGAAGAAGGTGSSGKPGPAAAAGASTAANRSPATGPSTSTSASTATGPSNAADRSTSTGPSTATGASTSATPSTGAPTAAPSDALRDRALAGFSCPRSLAALAAPVYFRSDRATPDAADQIRLLRLGHCAGRRQIQLTGHTDARQGASYNLQLSEQRAQAVADALRAGAQRPLRLKIVAVGKAAAIDARTGRSRHADADSLHTNGNRQQQGESRRVDIVVR